MDIRVSRTRRMLLETFERLLRDKSIEQISVREICELSTVRRGTFYRHFSDKYDLYRSYLNDLTTRFLDQSPNIDELADVIAYARYMHRSLISFLNDNPPMAKFIASPGLLVANLEMMVNQVAEGIVERIRRTSANCGEASSDAGVRLSAEFIGEFYSTGLLYELRRWVCEGRPTSAESLESKTTMVLQALLSPSI